MRPGGVLRYRLKRYVGQPLPLDDGAHVQPGDRVAELHLDNPALVRITEDPGATPWTVLAALGADLDQLARWHAQGKLPGVVALRGMTLFARAGKRLGFEFPPLPRTWGWQRVGRLREDIWPGEAWISVDALRRRLPGPE